MNSKYKLDVFLLHLQIVSKLGNRDRSVQFQVTPQHGDKAELRHDLHEFLQLELESILKKRKKEKKKERKKKERKIISNTI